jgi:periplasmic divalent cation tolerance protein
MSEPELVEIVTTLGSEAEALELARRLVEERWAACGNVAPVRSVYRWQGRIHAELEFTLALKTSSERAPGAERRLRELHPYETPAILRLAVLAANPEYAAWVSECVAPGEEPG